MTTATDCQRSFPAWVLACEDRHPVWSRAQERRTRSRHNQNPMPDAFDAQTGADVLHDALTPQPGRADRGLLKDIAADHCLIPQGGDDAVLDALRFWGWVGLGRLWAGARGRAAASSAALSARRRRLGRILGICADCVFYRRYADFIGDTQKRWLRGQDLNLRPSGYEPDELPGCSTPRRERPARGRGGSCRRGPWARAAKS